jgi:hypothetical protein
MGERLHAKRYPVRQLTIDVKKEHYLNFPLAPNGDRTKQITRCCIDED